MFRDSVAVQRQQDRARAVHKQGHPVDEVQLCALLSV